MICNKTYSKSKSNKRCKVHYVSKPVHRRVGLGLFIYSFICLLFWDVLLLSSTVRSEDNRNEKCKQKILLSYPNAKCSLAKSENECKSICGKHGSDVCKDTKGEIKKLHCRKADNLSKGLDPMTCCCSITCADKEDTDKLLGDINSIAITMIKVIQKSIT